jgi:hypothetical protein
MRERKKVSVRRTVTIAALAVLAGIGLAASSARAQTAAGPRLWVSLGHSTLDTRAPDWAWLRGQCAGGRLLQTLQPVRGQLAGIVVPVFDGGRAFYATAVSLFRGRNPQAAGDEAALRELLRAARAAGIPVYFGIDALAWQKGDVESREGLLVRHEGLQELNQYGLTDFRPDARYASPWNRDVRRAMTELVREIGARFPEAAGVALDVRLGDRQIHGFSLPARASFVRRYALDPNDFVLDNIAGLQLNATLRAWVEWKREGLQSFTLALAESYRQARPAGRVLVNGCAEYYLSRDFHDVRTAQDWLGWIGTGRVDGVMLEGRWLPPFPDIDQYRPLQARLAAEAGKLRRRPALVPVLTGGHLIKTSDYHAEYTALRSRGAGEAPGANEIVLLARDDADLQRAVALARDREAPATAVADLVGRPLPDFVLPRANGAGEWSSKEPRGQRALALFLIGEKGNRDPVLAAAASGAAAARAAGVETVIVSAMPVGPEAAGVPEGAIRLVDRGRELLGRQGDGVTRLLVDRAGYVRRVEALPAEPAALRAALERPAPDVTPPLVVGQPAPEFTAMDAEGRQVRLADFRGRKHVLLTFFPKCFTDG